jgi:SAM-dependent methyltransferase
MICLADVQPGDMVYDLGCGDGRLAIAAATLRGARSLGVDIEPYWVEQSRLNAIAAGVSHLAQFDHRDAIGLDLRPASVVFLYLVDWSTQMLANALLEQCAPGTRVVSHSFPFGSVPATRTEVFVDTAGRTCSVHLWVIAGPSTPAGHLDSGQA